MKTRTLFAAAGVLAASATALAGSMPSQFLMVPDWTSDSVWALDAFDGSVINSSFIDGSDGTLGSPKNAVSSGRGSIYVADQIRDTVTEWGMDGSFLGTVVQGGSGLIDNLRGMAVFNNQMYVTSGSGPFAGTVQRFDLDGANQTTFASPGGSPFDVYFYGNEALVTNSTTDNIDRFDLNGNFLGSISIPGVDFPQQIQERANGNLLVASFSGGASSGVYELDSNYNLVDSFLTGSGLRGVYELGNGNLLWTNGSEITSFDPNTGATTVIATGGSFQYIELFVVPTPGAAGLLGLAGLAAARRRR